jgi:hypothetical protein
MSNQIKIGFGVVYLKESSAVVEIHNGKLNIEFWCNLEHMPYHRVYPCENFKNSSWIIQNFSRIVLVQLFMNILKLYLNSSWNV